MESMILGQSSVTSRDCGDVVAQYLLGKIKILPGMQHSSTVFYQTGCVVVFLNCSVSIW